MANLTNKPVATPASDLGHVQRADVGDAQVPAGPRQSNENKLDLGDNFGFEFGLGIHRRAVRLRLDSDKDSVSQIGLHRPADKVTYDWTDGDGSQTHRRATSSTSRTSTR